MIMKMKRITIKKISNYDNKRKNRVKDAKINLNKINNNLNVNESKPRIYENINNSRDFKYDIGNNNNINYRTTNDEINKEKINYFDVIKIMKIVIKMLRMK